MASIFTKIISGEIPSWKIAEDDSFYSFLDIRPVAWGHALVVPKQEIDYIFDLPDNLIAEMNVFAKKVAKVLKEEVPCLRIGVAVVGLEVPHAHMHLIPLQSIHDIDFTRPRPEFEKEKMEELAARLRAGYQASFG